MTERKREVKEDGIKGNETNRKKQGSKKNAIKVRKRK